MAMKGQKQIRILIKSIEHNTACPVKGTYAYNNRKRC
jgi:hypothetical protein